MMMKTPDCSVKLAAQRDQANLNGFAQARADKIHGLNRDRAARKQRGAAWQANAGISFQRPCGGVGAYIVRGNSMRPYG